MELKTRVSVWDADRSRAVYAVPGSRGNEIRLREYAAGRERVVASLDQEWSPTKLLLAGEFIVYAASAEEEGTIRRLAVGLIDLKTGARTILDEYSAVDEPDGGVIGPGVATDGKSVAWSRVTAERGSLKGVIVRADLMNPKAQTVSETNDVLFVRALLGDQVVVWRRRFLSQHSPTALRTYIYERDGWRQIDEFAVNISFTAGGVLREGRSGIEIRESIDSSPTMVLESVMDTVPVMGENFIAWCSSDAREVSVRLFSAQKSVSIPSKCFYLLRTDGPFLIWLEDGSSIRLLDTRRLPQP